MKKLTVRKIMGRNFWGLEEWWRILDTSSMRFPQMELKHVVAPPWNPEQLLMPCPFNPPNSRRPIKDTHFAFLGLENVYLRTKRPRVTGERLTIRQWSRVLLNIRRQSLVKNPPVFPFDGNSWLETENFADWITCELRWYLMPIVPPADGEMIPSGYELAQPVEELTKNALYLLRHNGAVRPALGLARCRGKAQRNPGVWEDVVVGVTSPNELTVTTCNGGGYHSIGLALSRQPDF